MSKNANNQLILDNLFNSRLRVKVLKFLFRNYPVDFGVRELASRIQEPLDVIKKEVNSLQKMGLVKRM